MMEIDRRLDRIRAMIENEFMDAIFLPPTSCACGKMITFVQGALDFTCTRCDRKYVLNIEIKEVEC